MRQFRQILLTQLKWTRVTLAIVAVSAFVTPAVAWRMADISAGTARAVMIGFANIGPALALLSILAGFILAAQPWIIDAAAKHVYPLSLPMSWTRYVSTRFGAGVLTLLVPTFALWLGSVLTLTVIDLPATLNTYAGTLALRFLVATAFVYAVTFAIQYLAGRRSALVMLILLVGGSVIWFALMFFGQGDVISAIGRALTEWPGPLAVFVEDWMLVDV